MGEAVILPAVLGADPGVRGGVAVLDPIGCIAFLEPFDPRGREDDAVNLLRRAVGALRKHPSGFAVVEKVGYIRGDGGKGAFTFGSVSGGIRWSLKMVGVEVYAVPPILWQTKMECLTGGDKNVSKRRAGELFPDTPRRLTHAVADALLIALYGREVLGRGSVRALPTDL